MRFLAFLVGNWASRIYLLLVLAAATYLAIGVATHRGPDAALAGVPLIIVTVPWSCLAVPVHGSPILGALAILAGAVIDATIISWLHQLWAGRARQRP